MSNLPSIHIKPVAHQSQRYPTVGDYFKHKNGNITVTVSELPLLEYLLVAHHELTELIWVTAKGVKLADIDAFDIAFESNRKLGDLSEPGDQRDAPYFVGHQLASSFEKQLAKAIGVKWDEYEARVNTL